ncbi:xylulokinase [Solirubrobacter soli]|uniref:xylulokinase n=1 Tax=Solirubrobacter soli TaxID=363832 RepID=UPI0004292710|nr:FGGY family carbohydrate kinase [Solirubrobacter soli]
MGCVIGVDVGSQSVKAVVADDEGRALATASAPCTMRHPAGGWAEQDPSDWTGALIDAVRQARTSAGLGRDDITMLGLACQVDGLVALDAQLRAIRPAIIWLDRRADGQSAALAEAVGEDVLISRTGLNPDASHVAPKAMWLREVEPANYAAARWLASAGAHMNAWLTGEVAHDHAHASSTLLYDLYRRDYSAELIGHAGLDAARLPAIHRAGDVLGTLRGEIADALGLSRHCRVIVGTGDDHAGALGAGALAPGVIVDVTGTAEPVAAPSRQPVLDAERMIETHAHAVDEMLLVENPGFVSGGSTRWWAATQGIPQSELFGLAALAPAGADGALFLPTLSGSMAPRWNGRMRGCFAGLALSHDAAHLARAVLEGCAYALRDIVDRFAALELAGDEIRVVGGGARSALWLQIKADVTDRPVRAVLSECATSAGAAMLAGVADGAFKDLAEAAEATVQLAPEPVTPRPEVRSVYDDSYRAYRRLFDGVEDALA